MIDIVRRAQEIGSNIYIMPWYELHIFPRKSINTYYLHPALILHPADLSAGEYSKVRHEILQSSNALWGFDQWCLPENSVELIMELLIPNYKSSEVRASDKLDKFEKMPVNIAMVYMISKFILSPACSAEDFIAAMRAPCFIKCPYPVYTQGLWVDDTIKQLYQGEYLMRSD